MAEENKGMDVSGDFLSNMDLSEFIDISSIEGVETPVEGNQSIADDIIPDVDEEIKKVDEVESEDKDVEGKDTDNTGGPSSDDIKEPSPFTPYAKLVKDEGVLPNFNIEEWDGSPEGLIKGMQEEINTGIETYKETFDPKIKWLADNYEAGVPLDSLLQVDRQRFELESINDEALAQEDTQKEIVTQYLRETTQFNDATIAKQIDRLETTGDLEEEAKGYFGQLKEINVAKEQQLRQQAQAQRELAVTQQAEQLETFKSNLSKIDEIVPGVKLNTNIRDKVFKGLTTPVDVAPNGQPVNEIQKAFMDNPQLETTFAYLYYATNGFNDFKVFGSSGKKSAVKDFENAVKGMDFNSGSRQNVSTPSANSDLLEQMKQFAAYK